ncbi:MAG: cyclic nucleotide-binding domain-containing protein [Limnobacter sp.]|uniref:cyclic nucleotide-binding domain-containing protein n=1 Tax=Limnobacter sp. TaxID=2003368 RepID=UPI00391AD106
MTQEFKAGGVVALGGMAQAIVYGLMAFAPLGAPGLALGVYAGLASALIGCSIGALGGRAPVQFGGPRSSTALILAGSLLTFMAHTPHIPTLLGLLGLEVMLAAGFVLLAERQGVGRLMQHLPAPVLIGMNTTLGLFSAYTLLPAMAGYPVFAKLNTVVAQPALFSPWALVISLTTAGILVFFRLVRPNPLGLLIGLAAGLALHALTLGVQHNLTVQTGLALPWPSTSDWALGFAQALELIYSTPSLAVQLLMGAAVISLLVVLESMQSLLQVDQTLNHRHNTRRELGTKALANLLCGLACALPSANYASRSNAGLGVGARSRASEGWCALLLAVLCWACVPVLPQLPLNILATLVAVSSLFLIQGQTLRWIGRFLNPWRRNSMDATERFTVWVVLTMLAAAGMSNLLVGTFVGVLFVAVYFMRQQSQGGLHTIEHGPSARSRTLRPQADVQALSTVMQGCCRVTLEGSLFFGNAASLAIRLTDELQVQRAVILDCSAVRLVDETAALALQRAFLGPLASLRARTCVVMPGVSVGTADCEWLERLVQRCSLFSCWSADDAFFWIENLLLSEQSSPREPEDEPDNAQVLAQTTLTHRMNNTDLATLATHWARRPVRAGDVLFRQGDQAQSLFVLTHGQLSAWHHSGLRSERVVRLTRGCVVGEMALVDGQPRSATVVADLPGTVLELSLSEFQQLPDPLAHQLLQGLASELAQRVRAANQSLALVQHSGH